ncbi:MAG: 50S ribosomal protein L20 [Candidatus Wildermuthbacteria bacterium]|nr:50S ribosomal protein L20 [Candidatus Wildermuthbacteria bacterium]
MVRVKRGVAASRRRKLSLRLTKGFRWGRKAKYRLAKEALLKAWKYQFRDRRNKKRTFRKLWETQISSQARALGISYSRLIPLLKKNGVELDRKILSFLAKEKPEAFKAIIEKVRPHS